MKAGNRQIKAENKALAGHRILVTREYTADYKPLEERGAELCVLPTIETVVPENYEDLDRAIGNLREYNWLVFTSGNGVHFFLKHLLESGGNIEALTGLRVCAVGPGTAKALKRYGLKADLIPKRFSAEGLVEAFTQPGAGATSLNGISFLFPRAEAARDAFPSTIRGLGGIMDAPVTYRTIVPRGKDDLLLSVLGAGITIATFTSGSTFTNFLNMVGPDALPFLSQTTIAVIGPVTRQTVEKTGLHVSIMPTKATIKTMVEAIIGWALYPPNPHAGV